jgi:hypothetical protein
MNNLAAFNLLAQLAFAGVESSKEPASELMAVYDSLAVIAKAMGLLDEADAAVAAAEAIRAADVAHTHASAVQLKFREFFRNGSKPPAPTA